MELTLVGIGTGNPGHLTLQAVEAIRAADILLIPDKGEDKTLPTEQVKWLCETQGEPDGYIISPSKPIPEKGTPADKDVQPPHRQAAAYYRSDVLSNPRNLLVTMSEPTSFNPKPIVLRITGDGAVKVPAGSGGSSVAASVVAPRAG